ncbi:hypothetical protein JI59_19785 (plasmid) [Novosphingobium pentaromativorans US6-1]|nr:hypothetical protein JI59_19785 [Novosphingobium pentaromativorans US6-1]
MILHWWIAAFIVGNLALGFVMIRIVPLAMRPILMPVHAWIGLTVLLLTVARIGWRLSHSAPPTPYSYKTWERGLARAVHALFYILMLALPITGYLILSANPPNPAWRLMFWGIIHVPYFEPLQAMEPVSQKIVHGRFVFVHLIGAFTILITLILHIAGVVKHQLLDGDDILARMMLKKRAD